MNVFRDILAAPGYQFCDIKLLSRSDTKRYSNRTSSHIKTATPTLCAGYFSSILLTESFKTDKHQFHPKVPAAFWQMFEVQKKTFLLDPLSASYAMTISPTELISNRIAFTDRMVYIHYVKYVEL